MSKYYDVVNIAKGKWSTSIHLHLVVPAKGFETVVLPEGGTLQNIEESRLSKQVYELTKHKRGRPPVVQLVEVDYEARQAAVLKEQEVLSARAAKAKAALTGTVAPATPEDTTKKSKKSKGRGSDELTPAELAAVVSGSDLPNSR